MKLELHTQSANGSFSIETNHRLILLSGQNGVGKSTLIKDISTSQNTPIRHHFAYMQAQAFAPGVLYEGMRLTPHVVTHETLNNYNFTIGTTVISGQAPDVGITFEVFDQAFKNPEVEVSAGSDAQLVRSLITSQDRAVYNSGDHEKIFKIYRTYKTKLLRPQLGHLTQIFHEYHYEYSSRRYAGQNSDLILAEIGPPPWLEAQKVIDQLGMPYSIKAPDIERELPRFSSFYLARKTDGSMVPGDRLSSGERAALSLYDLIVGGSRQNRIFLFDDVDGFLHAPLLRKFIDALIEILRAQSSFAIWVSHSPVLAQMCKEASFYYMPAYGQKPEPIEKAVLVNKLSAGELVVAENFLTVFVEGADTQFYNRLFVELSDRGIITPSRQVRFVSPRSNSTGNDASCAAVNDIVKVLHQHGLASQYRGLIDLDDGNFIADPAVNRLSRYCKENYFFDPLNIYAWLLTNDMDLLPDMPRFKGLYYGGAHELTSKLDEQQLQEIIDFFALKLASDADFKAGTEKLELDNRFSIEVSNHKHVNYHSFLVNISGKKMKGPYARLNHKLNENNLSEQIFRGSYWPSDLVAVMRGFC